MNAISVAYLIQHSLCKIVALKPLNRQYFTILECKTLTLAQLLQDCRSQSEIQIWECCRCLTTVQRMLLQCGLVNCDSHWHVQTGWIKTHGKTTHLAIKSFKNYNSTKSVRWFMWYIKKTRPCDNVNGLITIQLRQELAHLIKLVWRPSADIAI